MRGRGVGQVDSGDAERPQRMEALVNAEAAKAYDVRNFDITRAEFEKGDLLRTAEDLVDPNLTSIRMTDIVGPDASADASSRPGYPGRLDVQADGGTHVRNTREVGRIIMGKAENKGKGHRRLSFTCEPAKDP